MDNQISIQDIAGACGRAGTGSYPANMPGKGSGDSARIDIAGSYTYAVVGAAPDIASEAGAIYQREIVAEVAARIPGAKQKVLGTAFVGTGLFLRDGGCGR
jgi:hypothetical protein